MALWTENYQREKCNATNLIFVFSLADPVKNPTLRCKNKGLFLNKGRT